MSDVNLCQNGGNIDELAPLGRIILTKRMPLCVFPMCGGWPSEESGDGGLPVFLNIGKFNLHHIWDRVPFNTSGLKIKDMHKTLGISNLHNLTPLCIFSQVVWIMVREHPCLSICTEPPAT